MFIAAAVCGKIVAIKSAIMSEQQTDQRTTTVATGRVINLILVPPCGPSPNNNVIGLLYGLVGGGAGFVVGCPGDG